MLQTEVLAPPDSNGMSSEETKLYEVGYLLLPMIAEEALAGEIEAIRAVLEKHGAAIDSSELPKMRPLAYKVAKKIANKRTEFSQAYFGTMVFKVAQEAAPMIKADLDKHEHLLRFLLIETYPYEAPRRMTPEVVAEPETERADIKPKMEKEKPVAPVLTSEDIDKEVEGLIAKTE